MDFVEEYDFGYRCCEECGVGFTLWYEQLRLSEVASTAATNGYCEKVDKTLCDVCWRVVNRK